jgi:NADH-quinone oxidoreductase subunit N
MNVNLFYKKKEKGFFLSNFEGFFNINSLSSYSFIIIFFSLSGIPPLSGFFSKFFIFLSLIESKEYLISFVTICISIISVFYYIRIIKVIFFESSKIKLENLNFHFIVNNNSLNHISNFTLIYLQFLLVFIFFYPSLLVLLSQLTVLGTFNF